MNNTLWIVLVTLEYVAIVIAGTALISGEKTGSAWAKSFGVLLLWPILAPFIAIALVVNKFQGD